MCRALKTYSIMADPNVTDPSSEEFLNFKMLLESQVIFRTLYAPKVLLSSRNSQRVSSDLAFKICLENQKSSHLQDVS
jgi:hypothetical protein